MLNIAGPEYDFGSVVYAVLQDCEHRRRAFDDDEFDTAIETCAKQKLAQIKKAYDEFGGSAVYWEALEKEVMHTAVPQYTGSALAMTQLERNGFNVWRGGDLPARLLFGLAGLIAGSIIIAIPWIPIFESVFAFALTAGGLMYPDLKRFMYERRYAVELNKMIGASAAYQQNANLHYATESDIRRSFEPSEPRQIDTSR
jgi:hypothetical protein